MNQKIYKKRYFHKNPKPKLNTLKKEGLIVYVRNRNVDGALNKLKKLVNDSGNLKKLKEKQFYEKPSAYRKRQKDKAKKRWQKKKSILVQKYGKSPTEYKKN